MSLSRFAVSVFSVVLMGVGAGTACGQDYPTKPIRMITGSIGGGGDFIARLIGPGMSGPLGQQVVVENRGSGIVPPEYVSKQAPDGYTLLVAGGGVWTAQLLRKVPYDAVRDFAPISLLVREVSIVAVHPSLPVRSVKELISLAKARPGELNYSTGSPGATTHLQSELFKSMAGINIVSIPYKGSEVTPLLTGEVQLTIADGGKVAPHVKSGRVRALAVTSPQPSALFPSLPTVAASGLPGYEATGMTGIWAPAKTPVAIINRLNQEIVRVLNLPDVRERFLSAGVEPISSSPEQFAAMIRADMAVMGKVIKDAGIKAD